MARNSESSFRHGSSQTQEVPMLQVPPSVALKARSRQCQQHNTYSNDNNNNHNHTHNNNRKANDYNNSNDGEEPEEEFRILQYPAEPWGRASRNRATTIIPSRRIISSLIEDIPPSTVSQDSTDTSRNRSNRRGRNTKRVALLKRTRSSSTTSINNATESSDGDSGSTFNTRRSTTSSAKKRPAKQLRPGPPPLSNSLNTTTTTNIATTRLAPKKPTLPRNPPRVRHTETPPVLQDEHVEVLVVDDDEDEKEEVVVVDEEDEAAAVTNDGSATSEGDYGPGRETMTQQQRQQQGKARSRRRSLLQNDEDQVQAVEQVRELEEVHQEEDRATEVPKVKGPNRIVERMDCVVIPVADNLERNTVIRSSKKGLQLPPRTDTGKFTKKDTKQEPGLKTMAAITIKDATLTGQLPIKATTKNGARQAPRRTIEIAPVLDMDLDAPRQTRSDTRNNPTVNPEPTKTMLPANLQNPEQEHQGSSQQPSKFVELPRQPLSTQVRTKAFHGWWLKRKENLAQDDNLGILVQGNMLEPRVMTWHTSTIKDAPEPSLVMTFTGSLYRLNGPIDVQKMEANGFSKDVIKAFRNGFPANWKTILGKQYGKQAAPTALMGKGRQIDKGVDTTSQNDHSSSKRQQILLTQQPRVSVQRAKPVIQQGQGMQEERQIVTEITPDDYSSRMIGEAPRRPAVAPVERVSVQLMSASLPSQVPTLAPPSSSTLNKDEAVEIITPVASSESLPEGCAVPKATTGTTSKKSGSILEPSPSSPRKEWAPTSATPPTPSITPTLPGSTRVKFQQEMTVTGQSSTLRRASAPESASLQEDTPVLRRSSAPDQSITAMGTWKAVGPAAYEVGKPLDKALDGNLRMRSKAVVEQIRERTRQRPDLSSMVVDRAVED